MESVEHVRFVRWTSLAEEYLLILLWLLPPNLLSLMFVTRIWRSHLISPISIPCFVFRPNLQ